MGEGKKPIVAIVGRPNVGKSTLFNRLVGSRKAIALNVPSVTRDRHYGDVGWNRREFLLVDTGGFPLPGKGSLEKRVREQIQLAMDEAQLILLVLDGREGVRPEDHAILKTLRRSGKRFFLIVNKIDGPSLEGQVAEFYEFGKIFPISAEHGYQVAELLDALTEALPPSEAHEETWEFEARIAIIGRPNVGKSSLLNYLIGEERVIVDESAGTTRDVIDTPLQVGGRRFLLLDTAGIRRKAKQSLVEAVAVVKSLKAIERSHLCLLVLDATQGIQKQDTHVAGYAFQRRKGVVILGNKWDLVAPKKDRVFRQQVKEGLKFLSYAPVLPISAKTGLGMEEVWPTVTSLFEEMGQRFPTHKVNEVLERLVASHNPPTYKGSPVRCFYGTQAGILPPTFVLFVNEPRGVHFSFQRYLVNGLREGLGLKGAPIQVWFRKRS